MTQCEICEGTGWICEFCETRWELAGGGTCCGAGKNCVCNPSGRVQWQEIYATTEPYKSLSEGRVTAMTTHDLIESQRRRAAIKDSFAAQTDPEIILRQIQAATGWSQERIARELGVSLQSVNHWMSGKVCPMAPYRAMIEALAARVEEEARP